MPALLQNRISIVLDSNSHSNIQPNLRFETEGFKLANRERSIVRSTERIAKAIGDPIVMEQLTPCRKHAQGVPEHAYYIPISSLQFPFAYAKLRSVFQVLYRANSYRFLTHETRRINHVSFAQLAAICGLMLKNRPRNAPHALHPRKNTFPMMTGQKDGLKERWRLM